jgi:signal transduction histidine kinase/ActR/RegA family two-component response regulator
MIGDMRLRTRLFQLVASTVVPLVILAIVLGGLLATREQDTFREGALAHIRAFMTAVDAELLGHIRAVEVLGASRNLENNLPAFYLDAERVLRSQLDWQNIRLARPDGQQLINLARPLGSQLAATPEMESLREVVTTGAPAVGSVFIGENTRRYGVPIRVPIFDTGSRVKYVLTAVIQLDAFGELIREQDLQATWVSGLIDATGHFIARVPELSHADLASEDFRHAVAGSREGWFRGLTVEKVDTYTAFKVSDVSDWSVGIAMPASVVNAGVRNAAWIIVLGTLFSVAIALAFAFFVGRRIAQPIARLAASARALGDDRRPARTADVGIEELGEVARALDETAEVIGERHALLQREQAALRDADRSKDAFLAMLGHELRNPLGAITTAAQVAGIAEPGGDLALQSQATIERQTRHMTRLIEDLLDVSRVTMGKVTLKREHFNLARLARRVVRTWERSEGGRTGRVELTATEVWVDADRARVEQVLANLLDNAAKFSPVSSRFHVVVRQDGDDAVLEVTDPGEGIAPDQLEHVFGLFVQGPSGAARLRGGMGVGLALVKRLVEMHGGTIEATSPGLGQGATFFVRLPAAPAASATDSDDSPSARLLALRELRILVTEDNDDAREMMKQMLGFDGHEVRVARDGAETLACLEDWLPDVVLMDIGLPDMEGYELARRIGENEVRRKLKLIALTGYGQVEDERRAYDAGFDLHLVKPVAPELLREVLAAMTRPEKKSAPP